MTSKDYQKFIELIEKSCMNTNHRNTQPLRQNQEYGKTEFISFSFFKWNANFRYGWIWKPFTNLDAKDRNRLLKPRCRAELSEFAEKLEEQKITARPKFSGVIFKL